MKKAFLTTLLIVSFSQMLFAQTLAPATSEDLNDFDDQLSQAQKDSSFGATVSAEAKNLKNDDSGQKKKMGQWVSEQRRKNDEHVPATAQSKGSSNSGSGVSGKDSRANGDTSGSRRH